MPRPGEAGHLAMNHAILAWLAGRGHDITVLLTRARLPSPVFRFARFLDRRRVCIEGRGLISLPGVIAAPRAAPAILARRAVPAALRRRARAGVYGDVDAVLGKFIDTDTILWCAARIAALQPRAVLVDTIFRAPLLTDPRMARVPSVIVAHDVFHRRHAALRAAGYRLFPPTIEPEEEAALLARAAAVAAIQPEEAALLQAMLPASRVFVAGMPVTLRPRPPRLPRLPDRLVFLGSDTLPNVDGLRWFLVEVWPLIRRARPAATLDVVGTVGRAIGAPPEGVSLLGRVANLTPALHRASLGVAPLRAGSGLKIKLLDLLAHGLAVAATPAAVAGFDDSDALLVAGDAAGLAERIAAALNLPAEARDAGALAMAARYDTAHVFAELATTLGA